MLSWTNADNGDAYKTIISANAFGNVYDFSHFFGDVTPNQSQL
jgi:hypothetical protein